MKQMRAISINKELYNRPLDSPEEIKKMKKMKIELFLPPGDIPQFIYPKYNEKEDNLIIEFKYMDEEKPFWGFNHFLGHAGREPLFLSAVAGYDAVALELGGRS